MGEYYSDEIMENEAEVLSENGVSSEAISAELDKSRIKAERVMKNKEKLDKLLKKAKRTCERLSNLPFAGKAFSMAGTMCDLVSDYNNGIYDKIPLATIISAVAALRYLVSPADLLPDVLPVMGLVDDASMLYLLFRTASNDIEAYNRWKKENSDVIEAESKEEG
jgi:uncharacterized membrane protein YkvA (DUF1232 family)